MRVGVYTGANHPVGPALIEGFRSIGVGASPRCSQYHRGEVEGFDLVVVYGGRAGARVRQCYEAAGIPVVTVDWGYMARVNTREERETGHYQVGLGGLNSLPPFECPPDRFKALGVKVTARGGNPEGYTLLIGQVPGDAAHGMDELGIRRWLEAMAAKYPDVRYRPHPLGAVMFSGARTLTGTLADALAGARLVVTWNSNTGNDALLAGVPVVAHGPNAVYADMCGETVPSVRARLAYFRRLAYAQWTLAEMRAGACQRFVLDHLLPGKAPAKEMKA